MTGGQEVARHFIGIMAKAPRAGHAKTRLARALPPDVAADLYRHFLLDTIDVARQAPDARVALVCPPGDGADLRTLELGLPVLEQPVPGLMQGLAFGIAGALTSGHPLVALINADSPTLPAERIADAFAMLEDNDVVLGPTADGGYFLIGARVDCTHLLCDAPYPSSETICVDTLHRAEDRGLRVGTIAPWFDIDLPAELARLARSLRDTDSSSAPHTRRALAAHAGILANVLDDGHRRVDEST